MRKMSLQVRCPLCGMQVNIGRIRPRPPVVVKVSSKGRGKIYQNVIATPSYVLKRIYKCLMLLRFYSFDNLPVESSFSLDLGEGTNYSVREGSFLPLKESEVVI